MSTGVPGLWPRVICIAFLSKRLVWFLICSSVFYSDQSFSKRSFRTLRWPPGKTLVAWSFSATSPLLNVPFYILMGGKNHGFTDLSFYVYVHPQIKQKCPNMAASSNKKNHPKTYQKPNENLQTTGFLSGLACFGGPLGSLWAASFRHKPLGTPGASFIFDELHVGCLINGSSITSLKTPLLISTGKRWKKPFLRPKAILQPQKTTGQTSQAPQAQPSLAVPQNTSLCL